MDKEAFYLQCLEVFHETAALRGCARHGMVIAPDKRTGRKRLSKMFRAAGDVIEDLSGAIGL